ncbi:GNAT family N-acetyltransferase [Hyphomonas sp.]|uniref:GNAT family N-acetyltransferase n=1 Tax=Hyphomonas sp. TaxID=87 RepID=UPI00391C6FF3
MTSLQADTSIWRTRIVRPGDLGAGDIAAWNGLRAAHPDYDTPLLSPAFAQCIGRVRRDARVALIEDTAGLAAAFAFHKRPDGLGRPIGAPFCDYSGPVVREGLTLSLRQITAMAGLGGYRTNSLLDPWNVFEAERTGAVRSQLVRMQGLAPADYLEQRRAQHPKRFKNFRRLESQMGRDGHQLTLTWGPLDDRLKAALYGFKSSQYRLSGLVDLVHAPKARALLDVVAADPAGFQAGLWAGDELVSADFGFREGDAFHPWIAAFNPAFGQYSPGNLLQKQVIEQMGAMGLQSYDLAEGHDHYKKYFTNSGRTIHCADIAVAGWRGLALSAQAGLWRALGADAGGSAAGRLKRRIDQAALSFDRTSDRLADLLTALRKRGVSATPVSGHAGDPE